MQSLGDIFKHFKLDRNKVAQLSAEAKDYAIEHGKKGSEEKKLKATSWNLFDDMSDKVWYSKIDNQKKISLSFQLFESFPSKYHFLNPFYYAINNKEITDPAEKQIIWQQLMKYLASENHYADPVGYLLWVNFFENDSLVRETWQGLLNNNSDNKSLLRLLESAGPVPFDLKEPVYKNLLSDEKNHETIFLSLLFSAYDFFGQLDKRKALDILTKLKINKESENYKLLKEKLK